jgi:calcineurin-like phosphoesterase
MPVSGPNSDFWRKTSAQKLVMSVFGHIGKIFKDFPMRRFFRSKQKVVTKVSNLLVFKEYIAKCTKEKVSIPWLLESLLDINFQWI